MRDSELYYGLFPYRNNEPRSIVIAARHEILRPLEILRGVADVLNIQINKSENMPPVMITIQGELEQVQNSIRNLLIHFSERDTPDSPNLVTGLREQLLPHVNQAQTLAKNMRATEHTLNSLMKEGGIWIEYVERASHEIWVIVDVLTNPDFELPTYLSNWLSMHDELNFQARQGNMQITEVLISELDNPEPNIRIESLICLGHLKNEQAVPFVIRHLNDEFDEVRVWAIETLKKIGGVEADQALKRYYDSQNNLSK
jgi:hypothetical protein